MPKKNTLVNCQINGQNIKVPKGSSVISAFKENDLEIAHYCWHPGLSVAGVCRLCVVEIEGMDKLQIACNTKVKEGMKITNQSAKVKETVRWGMEFHLINHPLDCPICDQAGECGLQEQYMRYGKYTPNMNERKVKKRKVVDLGSQIVLDTERCILCSRCVRFTDEVTKTSELGIFNRGNKSEIGIFKDKPLNNNYTLNTVDICPVGALTSKPFRFRQRVWYLKTASSVCPGCSTGCNILVDYNEEGFFRTRPKYNPEINGHWMCDPGRPLAKLSNKKYRLLTPHVPVHHLVAHVTYFNTPKKKALKDIKSNSLLQKSIHSDTAPSAKSFTPILKTTQVLGVLSTLFSEWDSSVPSKKGESALKKMALVLTAGYTLEELNAVVEFFLTSGGEKKHIFYWKNNPETFNDFDNILLRGDKNANTKGLLSIIKTLKKTGDWSALESLKSKEKFDWMLVAGPEFQNHYPRMEQNVKLFHSLSHNVIWWTAHPLPCPSISKNFYQIPLKTFLEKSGTFLNYKGVKQEISSVKILVPEALTLTESVKCLKNLKKEIKPKSHSYLLTENTPVMKTNYLSQTKRAL